MYGSAKDPDWFLLEEDLKWHPQGVILMNRCRGIRLVLKTDWFCFYSWSLWSTCKKKGNKLTKNGITDCQTTSVNRINRPKIPCAHVEKSSTFFKGIVAGNQNLTKLTFWERLNRFSIIRWRQSLCYCLSGLWANQMWRGARGQSDIWSDSFQWTLPGTKGETKQSITTVHTHTQHFVISIYDFRHEYTLMSSKTDQWTVKSSCLIYKLCSQT